MGGNRSVNVYLHVSCAGNRKLQQDVILSFRDRHTVNHEVYSLWRFLCLHAKCNPVPDILGYKMHLLSCIGFDMVNTSNWHFNRSRNNEILYASFLMVVLTHMHSITYSCILLCDFFSKNVKHTFTSVNWKYQIWHE